MGAGGQPPSGLLNWATVTADSLNVRTGATSDATLADEQGPLPFGSVVRIYEVSENGWFRISQSRQLWIYGRYTQPVRPAVVNTPDTNARIGPGTNHDVDRIYQQGDRVFVLSQNGNWSQIVETLWIHNTLLDFQGG
jgi:uncharacterized protein YgiM (DUF1202 family)